MKKPLLLLATLLATSGLGAQTPTAYFMEGSTFRSQFNPAFAPLRGYIDLPGLGGIQVGLHTDLSLDRIFFRRDGQLVTLLDPSVSARDALAHLKKNNFLGVELRTDLLGFGEFTRNHRDFWAFDLNLRTDVAVHLPKSLFEFVKNGRDGAIRNTGATASSYLEAGFSYSLPLLDDRLYVGAKAKFLVGLARARVCFDRIDVRTDRNDWTLDVRGSLDAHIPGADVTYRTRDDGSRYFGFKDIGIGTFRPAGYGFAVDLGATYDILPDLQASLAVTDLGFINWSDASSVRGSSATSLRYEGVTVEGGETQDNGPLEFRFDDLLEFSPAFAEGSTKMLRASINAGLEYELWRHKIGIGILYRACFWDFKTLHSFTGSVNFHPVRWFTLSGSYTLIDTRGGAFGLALNLCPGWINFFIGTDLAVTRRTPQYIPIGQQTMHLTFGLGIPLGRRSHRVPEYVRLSDRR